MSANEPERDTSGAWAFSFWDSPSLGSELGPSVAGAIAEGEELAQTSDVYALFGVSRVAERDSG